MISVADSFDTMICERPYRPALSVEQAVKILRDGRGRQWDPAIVDAFLKSIVGRLDGMPEPIPMAAAEDKTVAAGERVLA